MPCSCHLFSIIVTLRFLFMNRIRTTATVSALAPSLTFPDESSLKMNSVEHIPQTMASHARLPEDGGARTPHGADMLKPDPRDSFHSRQSAASAEVLSGRPVLTERVLLPSVPMIDRSRLDNVLPSCIYSPTYVVKDFPIARYQGLQFVSDRTSFWTSGLGLHRTDL